MAVSARISSASPLFFIGTKALMGAHTVVADKKSGLEFQLLAFAKTDQSFRALFPAATI
jgi:hypothetical protein